MVEIYTCNCNTLQLAILDTFKELHNLQRVLTMEDIANKCSRLVAHFHKAGNSQDILFTECATNNQSPNNIQQDDNWWNSKYQCMTGLLHHEECLITIITEALSQ